MAGLSIYKDVGIGKILANGSFAVDVFIMLSGFVIALVVINKQESYRLYLKRRFLRIVPAYIFWLIISIFIAKISLDLLLTFPVTHQKIEQRIGLFDLFYSSYWQHILAHITLTHGVIQDNTLKGTAYTIMGQAWSLTLEMQFYLIAPLLIYLLTKKSNYFIFVSLTLMFIEPIFIKIWGHKSFILANISLFNVGMLSYYILHNWINKNVTSKNAFLYFCIMSVVIILNKTIDASTLNALPLLIWFSAIAAELGMHLKIINSIYKYIFESKVMQLLGKISYSMYCSHMVFLYSIAYIANLYVDKLMYFSLIVLILPLLCTVVVSCLSYKYIEAPFIKFGKAA